MSSQSSLEHRLQQLAGRLDLPAEPDLAFSVRAAIADGDHTAAAQSPALRRPRHPLWSRRLAPVLVVALLAVAGVIALPGAREAVADWIGLDGLRIDFAPEPAEPLGADLMLGTQVSLDEAMDRSGLSVQPPAVLGLPDEVYLSDDAPTPRISLVYAAGGELPRTASTEVGVLLGAFRATLDENVFHKALGTGTDIEIVDVGGLQGYWLSGAPHVLYYTDERGSFTAEEGRLAGNTLAWQRAGIVYRLESALSKERAIEIARSIP